MKKVATLIVLLVASQKLVSAHALPSTTGGWKPFVSRTEMKSSLGGGGVGDGFAAAASAGGLSKLEHSVVENWPAVCEVVCSAGFGGPGCGANCYTQPIETNQRIHTEFNSICPALCLNGLGIAYCSCSTNFRSSTGQLMKNVLCNSFCQTIKSTLDGCSHCYLASLPVQNGTIDDGLLTTISNNLNDASSIGTTTSTTEITPDWSELCNSLCKTGDGGALCDCDIPPFDSK